MAMVAGLHVSAAHQMLTLPSSRRVSFNVQRSDSQEGRTTPTNLVFVDVVGLAFPFVMVLFSGTWAGGYGYSFSSTSPTASS